MHAYVFILEERERERNGDKNIAKGEERRG